MFDINYESYTVFLKYRKSNEGIFHIKKSYGIKYEINIDFDL